MTTNIFVTTTIPFVNAKPHIGHAQEFILTDAIARLHRSLGHKVILQSGTDENAFKNVVAAQKAGTTPETFVEQHSQAFRYLLERLNISVDAFVRTSEKAHEQGVHEFWAQIKPDDLYEKDYSGLYCIGCEDFFLEKDLVNGLCQDHKTRPQEIKERNIFFRLSKYEDQLIDLISSDTIRITPTWRKNEILSFIKRGLQDISLTRNAVRAQNWGIRVPGNEDQVVYVWIDALVNYLTGQGLGTNETWKNVWNDQVHKIHVIGKNVWKFHAIYWPALLLSAGLPLPNDIVIHGFLTTNGEKISKSLGNTIDPIDVINRFGADPLRHFLLHAASLYDDSDFSEERLRNVYNADLANSLGNLVSRLVSLRTKAGFNISPAPCIDHSLNHISERISIFDIKGISEYVWQNVAAVNGEITAKKPWELLKNGNLDKLKIELQQWLDRLGDVASALASFIPETATKINLRLSCTKQPDEAILFPRKS